MNEITITVDGNLISINLDATAFVKWENRAKAVGLSLSRCLSLFLAAEVQRT